jgi:pullulanase/glycogen debranching enzyme
VDFSPWINSLHSDIQLGANIYEGSTAFRIFAPRATSVRVAIFSEKQKCPEYHSLQPMHGGIWGTDIPKQLHGRYYYFQLLFNGGYGWWTAPMVLDPYAKATVSSSGPGIILDESFFLGQKDDFQTPNVEDLVILEGHVRDLLPRPIFPRHRLRSDFSALKRFVKSRRRYLRRLGVNCIELQPIQEFDYSQSDEYHWGYMPANWFSPASAYAKNPRDATQVGEFRRLVKTCHDAGIAVIMDVVYNHFGDSKHLQNIDRDYYFRRTKGGEFHNYSGCGNDFRTENPMARKMVIDSLEHFIRAYNVDGFRFDLAELVGMDFLDVVQKRLKNLKPSIILIAEPWSFRGNIGVTMKRLPYSVWNDEYREFVKSYVLGNGNAEGMRYFLCGSLDFRSRFPGQSVNYVASHDDRGWVDSITENPHNDGGAPTANDRRRTRLSAAILLMSIGVPMLTEGQDFLFSKRGNSNTYDRGDLNAMDYRLLRKHGKTHNYFARLIGFRLSPVGRLLRPFDVPSKTYFRFFSSPTSSACALAYNTDGTFGDQALIFAINPHTAEATVDFKDFALEECKVLANEDEFFVEQKKFHDKITGGHLTLPPLSCRIYQGNFRTH